MRTEIDSLIQEYLDGVPYILSNQPAMYPSEITLLFPCAEEKVREFTKILNGATTSPGFTWGAKVVPLVVARKGLELTGTWAAMKVHRKAIGAARALEPTGE